MYIIFLADMVVSGIPVATPFHAREVANMAIDLVKACTDFKIPHMPDEPLKIRVGLHSGKYPLVFFICHHMFLNYLYSLYTTLPHHLVKDKLNEKQIYIVVF